MKITELLYDFWAAVVAAVVAFFGWFVRRVLTNEKQIAVMMEGQKRRDEKIDWIMENQRATNADIKTLMAKVGE